MDVDSVGSVPSTPDIAPEAPVEAPQAPVETTEAPKTETPAPKDDFTAPAGGTPDASRLAAARDPKDGMDPISDSGGPSFWEKVNAGQMPGVEPAFYQAPKYYLPVPGEATHVGMTWAAGWEAGLNRNFVDYAADKNADVDAKEYETYEAHSYNFTRDATLQRAGDLGGQLEDATSRYQAAKTPGEKMAAAQDMATAYGKYLHLLQDNRAHGGTDRAEHYGANVDENKDSIKAGQADTRASMRDFTSYLRSRDINPMQVNPGKSPGYSGIDLWAGAKDKFGAPTWDKQSRMWDRDVMSRDIQNAFNGRLRMGNTAIAQ